MSTPCKAESMTENVREKNKGEVDAWEMWY